MLFVELVGVSYKVMKLVTHELILFSVFRVCCVGVCFNYLLVIPEHAPKYTLLEKLDALHVVRWWSSGY